MDRRAHSLTLVAALAPLLLSACTAKQPMPIALQDTWDDDERAHLLRNMERWEIATNHLVKFMPSPTLFHDATGEFERSDLDDGNNVIYKLQHSNADIDALTAATGESLLGYNFTTDILIFSYKLYFFIGFHDPYEEFDAVTLHELGHHFGLGHIRLHWAIMNDEVTGSVTCITKWDLEAFCQLYGCQLSDMHPECDDGF